MHVTCMVDLGTDQEQPPRGAPSLRPPTIDPPHMDNLPGKRAPKRRLGQELQHPLVGLGPDLRHTPLREAQRAVRALRQFLAVQATHSDSNDGPSSGPNKCRPKNVVDRLASDELRNGRVGEALEARHGSLDGRLEAALLQETVAEGEVGQLEVWVQGNGRQQATLCALQLAPLQVEATFEELSGRVQREVLQRSRPTLRGGLPISLHGRGAAERALDVRQHGGLGQALEPRAPPLALGGGGLGCGCAAVQHDLPSLLQEAEPSGGLLQAVGRRQAAEHEGAEEPVLGVDPRDRLHACDATAEDPRQGGRQCIEDLLEVLGSDLRGALVYGVEGAHHAILECVGRRHALRGPRARGHLPVAAQPLDVQRLRLWLGRVRAPNLAA
mmetsp:Transcript_170259/g.540606  ORF Transcript_170259/g.540606 Transcript_170259/m.540606 type:complete len:384 (+) Transcript_170259:1-1152(+)